MAREKSSRHKNNPLHAARIQKETDRRKRRKAMWALWAAFAGTSVVNILYSVAEYNHCGHLHVHIGLLSCDAVFGAMAIIETIVQRRDE